MMGRLIARLRPRRRAALDPVAERAVRRATVPPALSLLDLSEAPMPGADQEWRRTIRRRVSTVLVVLAVWVAGIEARLVHLQVARHEFYLAKAERQQQGVVPLPGTRGDIVDRNGEILAYSVDADALVAHPAMMKDPAATVGALCGALRDCTREEQDRLTRTFEGGKLFAYVRRSRAAMPDQVARVVELGLPGLRAQTETRRWYPKKELAAHVLGFVGQDDQGLGGVEAAFDQQIRGREGVLLVQKDGGQEYMRARVEQVPTAGVTLELTIDLMLQHDVERALDAGVRESRAAGGTAIVMDPMTGEILALANSPTFNPNDFGQFPQAFRKNRAVQDVYEPGSTFKIVTAAAAIDEGVVRPSDVIETSPGSITFPGRKPIYDVHAYDRLTFEDVIVKSSNVGAIKVGLQTGADRLGRFIRRFGLGQILEPNLPGQSGGIVYPASSLDPSGLASVSMGYQISVTALQMASVTSVIANGGVLMEPHIVRAIVRDGVREPIQPRELRRVIKPETAATVRTFMEGVVERGTGTRARLDRYQVAAKSGTAAKIVNGRYSDTDYNASFVGFVPSRQPVYTIVVVIDTPRGDSYYGGAVAAPVFKRISEAALRRAGVPPSIHPAAPVVITAEQASPVVERTRAVAVLPTLTAAGGQALMPDMRGLGARDALRVLGELGLATRLEGSGLVVTQFPEPGEPLVSGATSRLRLSREARPKAAAGPGGDR